MLYLQSVTDTDRAALAFVEPLYIASFPPDERRAFDALVDLLRTSPLFQLMLLCDEERPVGFISYWLWNDMAYVEHFAVDPTVRGGGYGAEALRLLRAKVARPVVLEVEPPLDEMASRRIGFYRRAGFEVSTLPYVQPPYSPEARPVVLQLMFQNPPITVDGPGFADYFDTVRERLHREVYGADPHTHYNI